MEVHHQHQCEEIFRVLAERGLEPEPAAGPGPGCYLFVNRRIAGGRADGL